MGIIEDYLNSLEGKSDLNPLEVAREMHELHNQEIGTRDAKITELTEANTEAQNKIIKRDEEITRQKARNYDLAMQIPADNRPEPTPENDGKPDGGSIKIADLFSDGVRARHFKRNN